MQFLIKGTVPFCMVIVLAVAVYYVYIQDKHVTARRALLSNIDQSLHHLFAEDQIFPKGIYMASSDSESSDSRSSIDSSSRDRSSSSGNVDVYWEHLKRDLSTWGELYHQDTHLSASPFTALLLAYNRAVSRTRKTVLFSNSDSMTGSSLGRENGKSKPDIDEVRDRRSYVQVGCCEASDADIPVASPWHVLRSLTSTILLAMDNLGHCDGARPLYIQAISTSPDMGISNKGNTVGKGSKKEGLEETTTGTGTSSPSLPLPLPTRYHGWTPVMLAVHLSASRMVGELLASHDDSKILLRKCPVTGMTALHLAVVNNDAMTITVLLRHQDKQCHKNGATTLYSQACDTDIDIRTIQDGNGDTPLLLASRYRYATAVQALGGRIHSTPPHASPASNDDVIHHNTCDFDRISRSELQRDPMLFYREYVLRKRPVIIEDDGSFFKDGKGGQGGQSRWTLASLVREYGDVEVMGGHIPYADVFGRRSGYTSIAEFAQYVDSLEGQGVTEPLYIFDAEFLQQTDLLSTVSIPPSVLSALNNTGYTHVTQFGLGPTHSGAPLHFHCDAINGLTSGVKTWVMLPPAQAVYSTEHPMAWQQRFLQATQFDTHVQDRQNRESNDKLGSADHDEDRMFMPDLRRCTQRVGELMYVPQHWAHGVINQETTSCFAIEFDSGLC